MNIVEVTLLSKRHHRPSDITVQVNIVQVLIYGNNKNCVNSKDVQIHIAMKVDSDLTMAIDATFNNLK